MDITDRVESVLWPWVERVASSWDVPGLAIAVLHDGEQVIARGFGTRDRTTGEPVTPDTLFHLASVSKTAVATAVLQFVEAGRLDLGASITSYLPGLPWADSRASRVTVGHLLSHTSGLGDAVDSRWHVPELDDGALGRFAAEISAWTLERDPGEEYAYSNAAYELLGHLVATLGGRTFEAHLREQVLDPIGITHSTFLRSQIPPQHGAAPHLGLPPRVVPGTYPYTRRHCPSSSLHSSAAEMGTWMRVHLAGGTGLVFPATHELMWEAQVATGDEGWHEQMARGWFRGTYRDRAVLGHSGADPGFQSNLALLPELGLGVTVMVNANNAPVFGITRASLDVLLGMDPEDPPTTPVTVALAPVLTTSGIDATVEHYRLLAAEKPARFDFDEEDLEEAVWGLVDLHRTDLARPLLELWTRVQPDSARAWFNTGWSHELDGRGEAAVEHLQRALRLDPEDDDVRAMLRRLSPPPRPTG